MSLFDTIQPRTPIRGFREIALRYAGIVHTVQSLSNVQSAHREAVRLFTERVKVLGQRVNACEPQGIMLLDEFNQLSELVEEIFPKYIRLVGQRNGQGSRDLFFEKEYETVKKRCDLVVHAIDLWYSAMRRNTGATGGEFTRILSVRSKLSLCASQLQSSEKSSTLAVLHSDLRKLRIEVEGSLEQVTTARNTLRTIYKDLQLFETNIESYTAHIQQILLNTNRVYRLLADPEGLKL